MERERERERERESENKVTCTQHTSYVASYRALERSDYTTENRKHARGHLAFSLLRLPLLPVQSKRATSSQSTNAYFCR